MENICKFSQGTIWQWTPEGEIQYNEGVQAGPRPVLIISNNTFNVHSQSVNCLTITSVLKESPVHVPIHLTMVSHIQCEQVQTVPKKELSEFKGVVSNETMNEVKEKIKFQFNMSESRASLQADTGSIASGSENQVKESLGAAEHEVAYALAEIKELFSSVSNMKDELSLLLTKNDTDDSEATPAPIEADPAPKAKEKSAPAPVKSKRGRKPSAQKKEKVPRRRYTAEDKAFIVDEDNSLDELIERFDFKDKETAYKVRYYFRRVKAKELAQNGGVSASDDSVLDDISGVDEDDTFDIDD